MPNTAIDNAYASSTKVSVQLHPDKIEFFEFVEEYTPPSLIQVFVQYTENGKTKTYTIDVHPHASVLEFKEQVALKTNVPPLDQRLIFAGKQLEIGKYLDDYNIHSENTIQLVLRLKGGAGEYTAIQEFIQAQIVHGNVMGARTLEGDRLLQYMRSDNDDIIKRYDSIMREIQYQPIYEHTPKLLPLCFRALLVEGFQTGNCFEMAEWTTVKLIESTYDQWIYICYLVGNFTLKDDIDTTNTNHVLYEDGKVSNEFDHAIVITYPHKVNSVTEMNPVQATVIDIWYNNLTCSLADYMATKHPYYDYPYAKENALALKPKEVVLQFSYEAIGIPFSHNKSKAKSSIQQLRQEINQKHQNDNNNLLPTKFEFAVQPTVRDERSLENLEEALLDNRANNQHAAELNKLTRAHFDTLFRTKDSEVLTIIFEAIPKLNGRVNGYITDFLKGVNHIRMELFCEIAGEATARTFFKSQFSDFETNPALANTLDGWFNATDDPSIILDILPMEQFNFYSASNVRRLARVLGINDDDIKKKVKPLITDMAINDLTTMLNNANVNQATIIVDNVFAISKANAMVLIEQLTEDQFKAYIDSKNDLSEFHQSGLNDPLLQIIYKWFKKLGITFNDDKDKTPNTNLGKAYKKKLGTYYWGGYTLAYDTININ